MILNNIKESFQLERLLLKGSVNRMTSRQAIFYNTFLREVNYNFCGI